MKNYHFFTLVSLLLSCAHINSAEPPRDAAYLKEMAIAHERMAEEAILHMASADDIKKLFQTKKGSHILNKIILARGDARLIDCQAKSDQVISIFIKPLLETVYRVLRVSVPEAVKSIVNYFATLDEQIIKKITVTKVIKDLKQQKQEDEASKEHARKEIRELHKRLKAMTKEAEERI